MTSPGANNDAAPSRLARKLGLGDAVVVGLGAMIGAGVFSAVAPAVAVAGNAVLVALLVAGALAACNATSSARLAALYPESGGAYVYGQRRLGHLWGFLAGWGFVAGKLASCTAMALTFGRYVAPSAARPVAALAVLLVTAVNDAGIRKTVGLTRIILAVVLVSLALAAFANLGGGAARVDRLWPLDAVGPRAVLAAAGLMFFAFAGYARLATLGEEVVDPARVIPRAIAIALAITLLVYAVVIISALAVLDAGALAASRAPLADAARAGRFGALAVVVRGAAGVASLGVLLSLTVGVSRTVFAMAAAGDLPRWLAAVHPTRRVPHRAERMVGLVVAAAVLAVDLGQAIGFSSFTVLAYYAVTNAAAFTLRPAQRRWWWGCLRGVALAGFVGCAVVAASLPGATVVVGLGVMVAGAGIFGIRSLIFDKGS